MGYNAIEIDGEVKLDLSEDTVTEETLPEGVTAHDATGEPIQGKMKFVKSINGKTGEVTLGAADVGADKAGTAQSVIGTHNTNTDAHNDIRLELQRLSGIINDVLDSEDIDLNELHEIVAYIKSNSALIAAITVSKVNVADIINNLTTNVTDKPLSAAQGVALKALIDTLAENKLDASALAKAISTALAQAKESGEFDGKDGKSAYEYAKNGGYTGSEEDFSEKLAAEWQLKADETLETESKEVVGAINEVSGKVENQVSSFRVINDTSTLVIEVKTAIEEAGGDISKYNYVQLTGYLNRLLMMSFAWAGGNYYNVTCTDPINGYRLNTYNASTVIDITTTKLRELVDLVVETTKASSFIDVTELPAGGINENALYRYTEETEKLYAVTTTSRNIAYVDGKTMTVEVIGVDTLPDFSSAKPVSDLIKTITLYYQRSDGKVYGAINRLTLQAVTQIKEPGWYEPTYVISNFAGVIDSVLDAEYGYVYVVRETETKIHILYYKDGDWHETINDYVPRLGKVSKEKFESTKDENVNVSGYRSISNDFDRVYVEGAGNTGVSGDYCLTPDAEVLPTNPWVAASEDKVERLPSIPVRNDKGEISVYTDENSTPDKAISKRYFNKNTVQYVRRKPEESSAVANAKVVSAHTWTPDDSLYQKYAETFDNVTSIPMVADITDKDLIAIFSESNADNSIYVGGPQENPFVECEHLTSAQSKYRFIRRGTENELVLSFDIAIYPNADLVNNRGFTMVAKNDILADTSIWGGSNLTLEYPKGGSGYRMTFLSQTVPFDYVGKWVNLRIEMDGLSKGSEARLYLNNTLVISGTLTASVASIKAYDFMILNWNNSNSGFRGYICFDNMYFGDVPDTVRYSGFDTLTPIAYDYEDERVRGLGLDTIVTRKPDGSMLTKKELTDEDDERSVVSKYSLAKGIERLAPLLIQSGARTIDASDYNNGVGDVMYAKSWFVNQNIFPDWDINDAIEIEISASSNDCAITCYNYTSIDCYFYVSATATYMINEFTFTDTYYVRIAVPGGSTHSVSVTDYNDGDSGTYRWNVGLDGLRFVSYAV